MSVRRGLKAAVLAVCIACASSPLAAGLISETLKDLETYLKAASKLVLQVATGLDRTTFESLKPEERKAAKAQLESLSGSLGHIFMSQTSFVHSLEFYVAMAKDGSKPAASREAFWNSSILKQARGVYLAVSDAKEFIRTSELFVLTLTQEEYMALGDNLRARSVVLKTFETMPPPSAPDDVLQLEASISHYKVLIENLRKLRIAVDGALRKIKDA